MNVWSRPSLFGILVPVVVCVGVGLLGAYSIASEPIAYIASMFYGIYLLYLLAPIAVASFIVGVILAISKDMKYAFPLFACSVVLPASYIGGLKSFEAVGLAQYKDNPINEMRPIDEEPNGNVIVVYTKESSFEEQQELSNRVIHPWKSGPGFTGETGVRASIGLLDIDGRVTQKILFRTSATETKKDKLRIGLQASPIVYRYFENLTEGEVRNRLEKKKGDKKL